MREHPDRPHEVEVLVGIRKRRPLTAPDDLERRRERLLQPLDARRIQLGAMQLGDVGDIEKLAEPGWNAVEMMTPEDWQSLTFHWSSLGSDELPLLTKTDRRQMIEHWGDPARHTTLRALHEDVWQKAVDALLARRVREHNTSWLAPRTPFSTQDYLDFVKKVHERAKQIGTAK